MGRFDKLQEFMRKTHAMGMGTRDAQHIPEYSRVFGGRIIDEDLFEFYVDKATTARALDNLEDNKMLSVVVLDNTFECYQLKGKWLSSTQANPEQLEVVKKYLVDFNNYVIAMGFRSNLVYNYPHSEPWAIVMRVDEIYEQTPKVGTGNKVS